MFSQIYLIVLALHVGALAIFGGTILAVDLRRLGAGLRRYSIEELAEGLRGPRRIGMGLAIVTGLVLFGAAPARYLHDAWFWTKIALLGLIAVNAMVSKGGKLAAGFSLLLWSGVICAGRGPATVKDVMHSVIDPNGDFVFESVQQIADERGAHQKAPQTDAEWEDLRAHIAMLQQAPNLLMERHAARFRDRSKNPRSESEPEQIQVALDADRPAFQRRARILQRAASVAMQAANAKDTPALLRSIDGIDKACENCHLHYWYPNDKRAQQAAREDGVADE